MSVQARLPWIGLALWAVLIVAASTFSLAHDDLANAAITPALALFAGLARCWRTAARATRSAGCSSLRPC